MRSPWLILGTLRRIGARKLALYARHRGRLRFGWYERKTPIRAWERLPDQVLRSARTPFVADSARIRAAMADHDSVIAAADRIVNGEILYFSYHWLKRP